MEEVGEVKDRDLPLFCYYLRLEACHPSKGLK